MQPWKRMKGRNSWRVCTKSLCAFDTFCFKFLLHYLTEMSLPPVNIIAHAVLKGRGVLCLGICERGGLNCATAGSFQLFPYTACIGGSCPAGTSQWICSTAVAYMQKCLRWFPAVLWCVRTGRSCRETQCHGHNDLLGNHGPSKGHFVLWAPN